MEENAQMLKSIRKICVLWANYIKGPTLIQTTIKPLNLSLHSCLYRVVIKQHEVGVSKKENVGTRQSVMGTALI